MSKRNSAPTVGWVFTSQIYKWVTVISVAIMFISALGIFAIWYSLKRDCTNTDIRELRLFGYWIHTEAGSTKPECPQYGD